MIFTGDRTGNHGDKSFFKAFERAWIASSSLDAVYQ